MTTTPASVTVNAVRSVDRWLRRGAFTPLDLGIFRIICGVVLVATQQPLEWIGRLPSSIYSPPPGPFRLVHALPSPAFFTALGIGTVVSALLITLGLATRWVSLLYSLLEVTALGFGYSFGKIDHSILIAIAPAILSFANWGSRVSLDSLLGRSRPAVQHWPLRLLAIAISVSFATAAIAKASSGWLSPRTQIARNYFLQAYFGSSNHNVVSQLAASVRPVSLWEVADWGTVGFEALVAISFLSWRLARVTYTIAVFFHAAVFLLFGIQFWWDVVAYGAFLPWSRLAVSPLSDARRRIFIVGGCAAVTALATFEIVAVANPALVRSPDVGPWILGLGLLVGIAVIVIAVRRLAHPGRPRGVLPPIPHAGRAQRLFAGLLATLALLSLPLGLLVKTDLGEPYPALFQPGFVGPGPVKGGRVVATTSTVEVTFSDGSRKRVSPQQILGSSEAWSAEWTAAMWTHGPVTRQTQRWLAARLNAEFAPLRASKLTANWVRRKYDPLTGAVTYKTLVHTTTVDLRSDG